MKKRNLLHVTVDVQSREFDMNFPNLENETKI
jgi:hypothetical protein